MLIRMRTLAATAVAVTVCVTGCGAETTTEAAMEPTSTPATETEATAPASPPEPDPSEPSGDDEILEKILTNLGEDETPDWFPKIPLPRGIQGLMAQRESAGNFRLMATLIDVPDPESTVAEYAAVLESDGWTLEPAPPPQPGVNPEHVHSIATVKDGRRIEMAVTGRPPDGPYSVVMSLTGFEATS